VCREQIVGMGTLDRLGPSDTESVQKLLHSSQLGLVATTDQQLHRYHPRNGKGCCGHAGQPRLSRGCPAQDVDQDIGIDQRGHGLRLQPSARRRRANSALSTISSRSRHMPKNSERSRSPKVSVTWGDWGATTTTISAGPTGVSSGSVIRTSRSGVISVVTRIVFSIPASYVSSQHPFVGIPLCQSDAQDEVGWLCRNRSASLYPKTEQLAMRHPSSSRDQR